MILRSLKLCSFETGTKRARSWSLAALEWECMRIHYYFVAISLTWKKIRDLLVQSLPFPVSFLESSHSSNSTTIKHTGFMKMKITSSATRYPPWSSKNRIRLLLDLRLLYPICLQACRDPVPPLPWHNDHLTRSTTRSSENTFPECWLWRWVVLWVLDDFSSRICAHQVELNCVKESCLGSWIRTRRLR